MGAIQILQDSYQVMIKDMIEFKRNRFEVAGLIAFPLIFLLLFGFIFPSGST